MFRYAAATISILFALLALMLLTQIVPQIADSILQVLP